MRLERTSVTRKKFAVWKLQNWIGISTAAAKPGYAEASALATYGDQNVRASLRWWTKAFDTWDVKVMPLGIDFAEGDRCRVERGAFVAARCSLLAELAKKSVR